MQAASLSTKTVFDMEKNAIVRSRLQLVEAMMRERNAAGAAKLAARAKAREDAAAEVEANPNAPSRALGRAAQRAIDAKAGVREAWRAT